MTPALLCGAICGLGLLLLVQVALPRRPGLAVQVGRLDAMRHSGATGHGQRHLLSAAELAAAGVAGAGAASRVRRPGLPYFSQVLRRLADRLEVASIERGWRLRRTRADLAVLGRGTGEFLATKVVSAVLLLVVVPLCWVCLTLFGIPLPGGVPATLAVGLAAAAFMVPDLALRADAERRRRDFRRVVGVFSDLVAMNLAGGRGLPEALLASASVSDYWALVRIRQALADARLLGRSPWEALGDLGSELAVVELSDLAGALTLSADDGAKIRASLSARAATLRRREMSDTEGEAAEKSQSMLVAQLLLCTAFMVFLAFPAVSNLMAQT